MAVETDSTEKQFIEEVGVVFEKTGLPRMAGRIFGWLLIAAPPHQSSDELAAILLASKGSISSMTRLLMSHGLVERISLAGERRDYYRLPPDACMNMIKRGLEYEIAAMHKVAHYGLQVLSRKNETAPISLRLKEIHDAYSFLGDEFQRLLERYSTNVKSEFSAYSVDIGKRRIGQ